MVLYFYLCINTLCLLIFNIKDNNKLKKLNIRDDDKYGTLVG